MLGNGGLSSYLPTGSTVPGNPGGAPSEFKWAQGGPGNFGGHCVTSSTLVSAGWGNADGCGSITLSFSRPVANPVYVRTDIGASQYIGTGTPIYNTNDLVMQTPSCGLTTVADDGKTQNTGGCSTGATVASMNALMNQPAPPSGSCNNTNASNTNHSLSYACMMIGQNTNGLVSSIQLNLTAGCATVTSIFTNPCKTSNPTDTEGFNVGLPLPTVQIAKTSVGGTGQFGYAVTGTDIGSDSITTSTAGTKVTSGTIHTATNIGQQVTIDENSMPANFTFTSVDCTDSSSSVDGNPNSIPATVDPTTHLVTIPSQYMVPSATITCAFVNTFTPPNNCVGGFIYTLDSTTTTATIKRLDLATRTETVFATINTFAANGNTSLGTVNALATDGRYFYFTQQIISAGSPRYTYIYDSFTGVTTVTSVPAIGSSTPVVWGAFNPKDGDYYYAQSDNGGTYLFKVGGRHAPVGSAH